MKSILSDNKKLKQIEKNKFIVTWKLIEIGYFGYEFIQPQISKLDIYEYAEILLQYKESNYNEIAQLIAEKLDDYEFNVILHKLAEQEESDIEKEYKKWIIYLTGEMLENLRNDYFEDLLTINEFWISLGQPEYSPHMFQSVENSISPQEYYTKEMYELILNKHKEWIKSEAEKIIQIENIVKR